MKKQIVIIGGGPTAFLLGAFLNTKKFDVTIYEKNKTVGRKFLVAGKGGFNLTHSEPIEEFVKRYTPNDFLTPALMAFTNVDFREWLAEIGIPTFVGSSKRLYPEKGIKPIEVKKAILNYLKKKGVVITYEKVFSGWDEKNTPILNDEIVKADYIVFSLGGGSWEITGSDGSWRNVFADKGIKTKEFKASNCGYEVDWKSEFIKKHEGVPLKNIAISCEEVSRKGEVVITKFGLEGNAIYGLSPQIRAQLTLKSKAIVFIDFKPSLTLSVVTNKIKKSIYSNTTQILKKELKLTLTQIALLKHYLSKDVYLSTDLLAKAIKKFPLEVLNSASVEESISTVGGIHLDAISSDFELKKLPNQFCAGEMLDWDAPTGGYLLQACASIGVYIASVLNKRN